MMKLFTDFIDYLSNPQYFFTIVCVAWVVLMATYKTWTKPKIMIPMCVVAVLLLAISFTDHNFYIQATKADNIPIWYMTAAMVFFFWLCMRRGSINDDLMAQGKDNLEKRESQKRVYTWPDLVYSELICMVVFTAFLIVWAILFKAPLEDPANAGITPPIAKAPWYFLGLQEILVYYDPWIAGVVLPGLIVVGLMAIPYFDANPKGNGYYTVKERYWAIWLFGFGYIVLWIALIFLGTFMRGPGWNFFGPFEYWDSHKVVAMSNINLSEIIWVKFLHQGLPKNILVREVFGLLLCAVYMTWIPYAVVKYADKIQMMHLKFISFLPEILERPLKEKIKWDSFKNLYEKMGFVRFNIFMMLLLIMLSLPIKMYLRWALNLKYIVSIPEFMFNI